MMAVIGIQRIFRLDKYIFETHVALKRKWYQGLFGLVFCFITLTSLLKPRPQTQTLAFLL